MPPDKRKALPERVSGDAGGVRSSSVMTEAQIEQQNQRAKEHFENAMMQYHLARKRHLEVRPRP